MYKVIIVDDEPSVKRSLKTIIEKETSSFVVSAFAENGQEALDLISEFLPDVVITDIRMPVMDGLRLAEEIGSRGFQTEVIIISGYSDFSYAKQALRHGVSDYLLKPLDVDEVLRVLSLTEKKLGNERKGIVERSEWIAVCKVEAESMAKHMWVLNMTAVWEQLEGIHERLQTYRANSARLKEMYIHLFYLLQAEIAGLSGNRIQLKALPDYEWNGQAELLTRHIKLVLQCAMEEIRHIRNWGSHKNMLESVKQINQNFSNESFSMMNAAELAGMSPTYFSKSFKEEVGVSYTQYIAKLRMDKAIELLSDPNNKVYEVAYAVGYNEYAHFAKVFKKYFKFSPTEYRHSLEICQNGLN
ncbi:Regulator of RpoS [Paenibacillus allorhizoplanae]|uniref:Regulator of RpoS n=1 Tax=Paenibacillus allorhizoplanae TaxID=2905648 RepID=A0ABM9CRC7_9BACL|nr:response regulator [Paenibacillus allorhizoplanae]CAH1221291.1 Regulator of RpoS [Paenibacillus allorhizoplanae]